MEKCLADILQALELGEPEGFISVFVEEGKPVADALMTLLKRKQFGTIHADYIKALLDAFPKSFTKKEASKKQLVSNFKAVTNEMTEIETSG